MAARKPMFGGDGKPQGDATTDLMGAVRRSPDCTMLAIKWPSPPSPSTWAVSDRYGSVGYEKPERVQHWPIIGAVPGSLAAGMELATPESAAAALLSHTWDPQAIDILHLLVGGKTMERAAVHLGLSLGQVKHCLSKAFREFGVTTRAGLVHIACCDQLLPAGQPRVTTPRRDLKPQEVRALYGLAASKTYAEIGADMYLSRHTVTSHVKRALAARGAATAAQLVYLAHQDGLLTKHSHEALTVDGEASDG